jgi:hypothetical protein
MRESLEAGVVSPEDGPDDPTLPPRVAGDGRAETARLFAVEGSICLLTPSDVTTTVDRTAFTATPR